LSGWAGMPVVEEDANGGDGLELGFSGFRGDVHKGSGQEIDGVEQAVFVSDGGLFEVAVPKLDDVRDKEGFGV